MSCPKIQAQRQALEAQFHGGALVDAHLPPLRETEATLVHDAGGTQAGDARAPVASRRPRSPER